MEVIEIESRWNGEVLYSGKHAGVKEAVEAAVKAGANLGGAHLDGANHAQHYIEAMAFAKRLLKDQAEGKL